TDTLSLHDALPISSGAESTRASAVNRRARRETVPGALRRSSLWLAVALLATSGLTRATSARGATDLRLAPGLSFTDDSSDDFPIRGQDLGRRGVTPGTGDRDVLRRLALL